MIFEKPFLKTCSIHKWLKIWNHFKISQNIPVQTSLPPSFKLSQKEPEFVKKQLKSLKVKKSTGIPGLPAWLQKDGSDAISEPLTLLMNRSLRGGYIPDEWKHALVTPIHKAGSKSAPSNYRPISVLPVFSKILERGIHKMVYDHLQLNNLLSPSQSGFCPLHSTSTCLTHVTNTLLQNIEKGLLTGLVFLDLSKAFDTQPLPSFR